MGINIESKAKELVEGLKNLDLGSKKLADILSAIPKIVCTVEKEFGDLTGDDKKELVVNVLNMLIDVPLVPESVEGWMIRFIVDKTVKGLNDIFGKDWVEKTL